MSRYEIEPHGQRFLHLDRDLSFAPVEGCRSERRPTQDMRAECPEESEEDERVVPRADDVAMNVESLLDDLRADGQHEVGDVAVGSDISFSTS